VSSSSSTVVVGIPLDIYIHIHIVVCICMYICRGTIYMGVNTRDRLSAMWPYQTGTVRACGV